MFEKLQIGEKIHDAPRQPRTCSHPIYAQTLTGVCQAIKCKEKFVILQLYGLKRSTGISAGVDD